MRRIYLQLPLFLLVVDFIHQAFVCCLVSLCCCNKTKIHPRTNDYSDKFFPPCIITRTTRIRHKSALSRVDACNAQKKRRRFAAGTRTLVDRGHYFHLKAGHDNHLHHSEPIRKWYDASFLACVTLFSRY